MKGLLEAVRKVGSVTSGAISIKNVASILGLNVPISISLLIEKADELKPTKPTPWVIVLCKFSDRPEEPESPEYFTDWLTLPFTGGLFDYWRDMSYGSIDLSGSVVKGWYTLPYTRAQDQQNNRGQRITSAINAVRDNVDFSSYYGIIIMFNAQPLPNGDSGAAGIGPKPVTINGNTKSYGLICLDLLAWYNSFAAHEMGHAYGLDHSFSDNPTSCGSSGDGRAGAYCDKWDIMSYGNDWCYDNTNYGISHGSHDSGPSLNAWNRYSLGWIPLNRIWNSPPVDPLNAATITITLAPINQPECDGYLMANIKNGEQFTVEFRRKYSWDKGIPQHAILIHQIHNDETTPGSIHAYLLTKSGLNYNLTKPELLPGDRFSYSNNNVHIDISVISFDVCGATIDVSLYVTNIHI